MPLVTMKELLTQARASRDPYAVGAFSVGNMEMVLGAVRAAEELRSPAILQIAEVRLPTSPLEVIGPMMVAAARAASVPVAVHFDHGVNPATIQRVLELGFTSVMFDGSHLPLPENIRITRQVKEAADAFGATLEAEIGRVGGSEDGGQSQMICSDVDEALRFAAETGVDALAVAIGNAHGHYKGKPNLHFDVLEAIHSALPDTPLVLHGGSGISDEDFRRCIRGGVKKVNIATASFTALTNRTRELLAADASADYFRLSSEAAEAVQECVARHIRVFMSDGRVKG